MSTILRDWAITGPNQMKRGPFTRPLHEEVTGGDPPPPQTPTRDSLVYGQYKPDATTTGVLPGSTLTDYNSSSTDLVTLSQPGLVIENQKIYGRIKPANTSGTITLRNCLLVGPNTYTGGASAIVDCNGSRGGKIVLIDCTIKPRVVLRALDGVVGKRYEAYRCNVSNTIDGFGVFTTTTSENADVTIRGCWVHDTAYFSTDGIHSDGTHNDCIQLQGGSNVNIQGNWLEATSILGPGSGSNPSKPWLLQNGHNWANGSVIIVQNNTKAGINTSVVIEDNWLSGGLSHLNVKPNVSFIYRNNHHYRDTAIGPAHSGYWIRFDDHTSTVTGVNSGTNNNKWVDGPYTGQDLTEPRDKGIEYNK